MFVLKPGHKSPWISLNEAMRLARESTIADNQAAVNKRKASKAPQSEETDYDEVQAALELGIKAAKKGQDSEIIEAMQTAGSQLGSRVVVPKPWEDDPRFDGIEVRFIAMARASYADIRAQVMEAIFSGDWGPAKGLIADAVEVNEAAFEGDHGLTGVELYAEAEILSELLTVALHFQGLSHDEKKRYGSQAA